MCYEERNEFTVFVKAQRFTETLFTRKLLRAPLIEETFLGRTKFCLLLYSKKTGEFVFSTFIKHPQVMVLNQGYTV